MKQYFAKLKWESYSQLIEVGSIPFKELDKFADYTFENGISIRISTGKMAHSTREFPYEMIIKRPGKEQKSIPNLNNHGVAITMERLENENNSI